MELNLVKDEKYTKMVHANDIHGKYPYKVYLEIIGNSTIGKYIVVISDEIIHLENDIIQEITITFVDKAKNYKEYMKKAKIAKPNMLNQLYVKYKVREKSVVDVKDKELAVFKPLVKEKSKLKLF